MASFYAELHVEGRVYVVANCRFSSQQSTGARGRANAKVRQGPLELVLERDADDHLILWGATPHAPKNGHVVFFDIGQKSARETVAFTAGHLVQLREVFGPNHAGQPAYYCALTITAEKFELLAGAPANPAAIRPAAGTHGTPPVPTHTGGRGPRGFGDTIGSYSGRPYDPDGAGGPVEKLNWQTAQVEASGITTVRKHVGRFGRILANEKMLARLEAILAGSLSATDFDKRFYTHELREYERYRNVGVADGANPSYEVWNDTHTATLEDYQINEDAEPLYHPSIPEADFFTEL